MKTNNATTTATINPLEEIKTLMEKRNALALALIVSDTIQSDFDDTVNDLCDRLAFLSVKKALEFKQSNPTNMPSSALAVVDKMLTYLYFDYATFKHWSLTDVFGDTIPLYDLAYMTAYEYLKKPIQLNFDDVVYTHTAKNGNEKNYTLYQYIKHEVHKDIRAWSTTESADLKKMYYLIGYTENGKQITTRKRPATDIDDISEKDRKTILNRYKLTARQEDIVLLYLDKKTATDIATALSLNLRMVQRELKEIKHILAINNPYIKA